MELQPEEQGNLPNQQPDREVIAQRILMHLGLELPVQSTSPTELDRFADMPNRRQALRAKDSDNLTVYLSHAIAKKLYRCPCCANDIPIGSEHVIWGRIQPSKVYTHHHLDRDCTQAYIIPSLKAVEIILPQQATAAEINRKTRNYRSRKRRV